MCSLPSTVYLPIMNNDRSFMNAYTDFRFKSAKYTSILNAKQVLVIQVQWFSESSLLGKSYISKNNNLYKSMVSVF